MAVTYSDRQIIKKAEAGTAVALGLTDPIGETGNVHASQFVFDKATDDAMASTTTSETYLGIYFARACKLKSIVYVPTTGGITASDTVNIVVTVSKRDAAAANKTTVATLTTTTTSSGSLTQGVGKALVIPGSAILISAGSTLTYEVAKVSTGTILRAGRFTVEVEWD